MGILDSIKNIFWGDKGGSSMSFYQLYSKLREWKAKKVYPYDYELPEAISFPPEFWKEVIKLYKYTRGDKLERAISVFWADGDLIFSSVVKGNEKSVTPSNNVRVSYTPSRNEGYYTKEVFVDNKQTLKREIYKTKVPQQIEVKYLFNMHTHPPHENGETTFYTFFSLQDIKSLLSSNAIITGMIGDKLWLLFRTYKTPAQPPADWTDANMNVANLTENMGIVVYSGDFKGKLVRQHTHPVE